MLEFALLAATCAPDIHPTTLAAVVSHESRANPFAIGVNGKATRLTRQPRNLQEAVTTVNDLRQRGVDFDAGLGQINVRNWRWLGLTSETVFDPCTNLRAAQRVLADCYIRASQRYAPGQPALIAALSCYNTGNFERGQRNGYVQKVYAQAGVKVPPIGGTAGSQATTPKPNPPRQPDAFTNPPADAFSRPAEATPPDNTEPEQLAQP